MKGLLADNYQQRQRMAVLATNEAIWGLPEIITVGGGCVI